MAATWINTIHPRETNSIPSTIKICIDYLIDDEKTDNGRLVLTRMCNVVDAHDKFYETMLKYKLFTGRSQENPILCYHVRQSFAPGEITPEAAQGAGHKFALELTQAEYAFVLATHIDPSLHTTNPLAQ